MNEWTVKYSPGEMIKQSDLKDVDDIEIEDGEIKFAKPDWEDIVKTLIEHLLRQDV